MEAATVGNRGRKRPEWEKAGGSGRWRKKQVEASGRLGIGWKAEQLAERVLAYGFGSGCKSVAACGNGKKRVCTVQRMKVGGSGGKLM
jgi:hypothetical protein